MIAISPNPTRVGNNALCELLQICRQLHACSDLELQAQVGHLAGPQQSAQMLNAVRLLLHSSIYIQQRLAAPATGQPDLPISSPVAVLSSREREVLTLLAQGCTMPQIGESLFISPATVNNHCARMREKLGLRGRNTLLNFAITGTAS